MGLFTIRQVPKGDPDALITLPDRPGFHEPPRKQPPAQHLALEYPPLKRTHRQALRALDMPSSRERVYLENRSPRDSIQYVDREGQLVRTESRSPNNKERKEEKRLSVSLSRSYSTSPRSPRSPRSPVIVHERSPRLQPLVEPHSAPTFPPALEPLEIPAVPRYPVFVRAPTGEEALSRALDLDEDSYSSSTTDDDEDDDTASDGRDVRYRRRKRRSHKHNKDDCPPPPPPVPEAPPIVVDRRSPRRRRHSRSTHSHSQSPRVGWDHEYFDGDAGLDIDFDRPIRRRHSHRDGGGEHTHHHRHRRHHSHHHHRHASHQSSSSREGRSRRDRLEPEIHQRPRAATGPSTSRSPRPEGRRERSWTSVKERSISRDGTRREYEREEEESVKGMLEDPKEVRRKELVEETEIMGDRGERVKRYHYR